MTIPGEDDDSDQPTRMLDMFQLRASKVISLLEQFESVRDDKQKRVKALELVEMLDLLKIADEKRYQEFLTQNVDRLLDCLRFFMQVQDRNRIAEIMAAREKQSKHFATADVVVIHAALHLGMIHILTKSKYITDVVS